MVLRALITGLLLAQIQLHASEGGSCADAILSSRTPASVTTPQTPEISDVQKQTLKHRYDVNSSEILRAPRTGVPVIFRMSGHETLVPRLPADTQPVRDIKSPKVTIVGGGPAGLTAALYLAEAGVSVVIVERNEKAGGLGMGSELKGIRAGGGAAYSAGPEGGLEYEIFRKIGLGKYKQKISIEEPIDSYLWKGKLYKGIWEDHTLAHLPKSFKLFKHALLRLAEEGAAKDSGVHAEWADSMDMAALVRRMPELLKEWADADSTEILRQFKLDRRLDKKDPMKDVIDLLDLYGRSALGGPAELISARQFIDFYESEIYTRYTGTLGTGTVAEHLLKKLAEYPDLVEIRTSAPVMSVQNAPDGSVLTVYANGKEAREIRSDTVIFAAPISLAPRLIKGLKEADPEKAKAISEIKMTDYAVHVVRLKGHPFRATYDTWVFNDGNHSLPTDYILGRWQDPEIRAYEGTQDFRKNPSDDFGIITIYHPLGDSNQKNFNRQQNLAIVDTAVENLQTRLQGELTKYKQKLEIELVESYRWPDSIHVVHPGYLKKIPILARPVGNIFFANNTIAAPELETAMARGAREAMNIVNFLKGKRKKASNE
jgi:protoporphyrinogen oxidase